MARQEQPKGWDITSIREFPKGSNALYNPFSNSFYGYRQVELTLPSDKPATFYGILVGPCVHSVVFGEDDTTYLVRQHRPNALRKGSFGPIPTTFELPGGFAKDPNNIEASVRAELEEETRGRGLRITQVGKPYTAPGVSDEVDHIFMVEGFQLDDTLRGSDEVTEADMDILVGPFDEIYGRAMRGDFPTSSQTLAGLALAAYNR